MSSQQNNPIGLQFTQNGKKFGFYNPQAGIFYAFDDPQILNQLEPELKQELLSFFTTLQINSNSQQSHQSPAHPDEPSNNADQQS